MNIPKTLAGLRLETYREFSWPSAMGSLFLHNGLVVGLITALSVAAVMLLTILFKGYAVFFGSHTGVGSFYRVIPYAAMVVPFSTLGLFVLYSLWKGTENLWEKNRWKSHGAPESESKSSSGMGRPQASLPGRRRSWMQLPG